MASYRVARAAEDVKRELSDIMRELKDPRVTGLLSIVKLDLSKDYSYCKVYISSMEGLEAAKQAVEGLESASGYIRRQIGQRIRMRRIPEFSFLPDDGIAYSVDINKKIREL